MQRYDLRHTDYGDEMMEDHQGRYVLYDDICWRPIDTAPTDGQWFLARCRPGVGALIKRYHCEIEKRSFWMSTSGRTLPSLLSVFSHWMPIHQIPDHVDFEVPN